MFHNYKKLYSDTDFYSGIARIRHAIGWKKNFISTMTLCVKELFKIIFEDKIFDNENEENDNGEVIMAMIMIS
jgi:hypothetical protein